MKYILNIYVVDTRKSKMSEYTVGNYTTMDYINIVTVKSQDTVSKYCEKTGLPKEEVRENNNLGAEYGIIDNQKLVVEFPYEKRLDTIYSTDEKRQISVYEVQSGDTIESIFDNMNVNPDDKYIYDLLNPNNTRDSDLETGEKLALPYTVTEFELVKKYCPNFINKYDFYKYLDTVQNVFVGENGELGLPSEASLDYSGIENFYIMLQNTNNSYPSASSSALPDGSRKYSINTNGNNEFFIDDNGNIDYNYISDLLDIENIDFDTAVHDVSCNKHHNAMQPEYKCNNKIITLTGDFPLFSSAN